MKKTLIITLEYPPQIGGIATYVRNLAVHLPSDEVVVYAPKMIGGKEYDLENPWRTIRKKPMSWLFWPRWIKMFWQVRKIVKREKIEQIFVQHVLPTGYVAYLIKKLRKVPYTIFLHGTDLQMALKKKRKLKAICVKAEKIVVSSEFLKEKFLAEVGMGNVVVVNPAPSDIFLQSVDKDKLNKIKSELALHGKKVILTVSRLAEGKGLPHLIKFLPKILRSVPNAVWLVIGDGPKREEFIELVRQNNLQSVVRFIGKVAHDDLPIYYQAANIFVLLTHKDKNTEEGWGTVFLEAAASGLPVIAGQVGGVAETVEHGKTGFLVDIYNEDAFYSTIIELLKNDELRTSMGQTGKRRVEEKFLWSQQIDKIVE
jgi:phosphatidylinositol alpha-1,6-mannosyltransferase